MSHVARIYCCSLVAVLMSAAACGDEGTNGIVTPPPTDTTPALTGILVTEEGVLYLVDPEEPAINPLYDGEGALLWAPAWSPDRRSIAFQGACGVHILDVDSLVARPVTTCGEPGGGPPSWSPDGQRIAFPGSGASVPHSIGIVDSEGSEITYLVPDSVGEVRRLSWSPAGAEMVFNTRRMVPDGQLYEEVWINGAWYTADIWILDLNDLSLRYLGEGWNPAWSPDAQEISYWLPCAECESDEPGRIYARPSDGSGEPRVIVETQRQAPAQAAWSPDGTELVVIHDESDVMWFVGSDGSGPRDGLIAINDNDPPHSFNEPLSGQAWR